MKKLNKFINKVKNKFNEYTEEESQPLSEKPKMETEKKKKCTPQNINFTPRNVAISTLVIIGLLALAWILILIKSIIFLFFVAFLFAAALDPIVDALEKKKIPRGVTVIGILIISLTILIIFFGNLIPIIKTESTNIVISLQNLTERLITGEIRLPEQLSFINEYLKTTFSNLNAEAIFSQFSENIRNQSGEIASISGGVVTTTFKTIGAVFGLMLSTVFVLLLTYYFTVDEKVVDEFIQSIFPEKHHKYISRKTVEVKNKIGKWLRGQILLMFAVGFSVYIGLSILGVKYAFTLALFAGLTELVPVIGPWIGVIPALPIAANISGTAVLWVLILYFVIQQIENNIFVPVIMKKATGLNPIVVLFAMAVGYELADILGIIIAIPTTASLSIFLEDYLSRKK